MEKEFPIHRSFDWGNRQVCSIWFSGLKYVTFVMWNRPILCATATAASFSKRPLGSSFHINWWLRIAEEIGGVMRVRVKAAHNYVTIVKMLEFRQRGCNRPHIVATASAVDSVRQYMCAVNVWCRAALRVRQECDAHVASAIDFRLIKLIWNHSNSFVHFKVNNVFKRFVFLVI